MTGRGLPVAIVRACLRDGEGGSPTAVMEDAPLPDHKRRRVPEHTGTSHAVFVSTDDQQPRQPGDARRGYNGPA
jgi:trans-2,3-dihydro-3-hydroxyanthranilate isomerase